MSNQEQIISEQNGFELTLQNVFLVGLTMQIEWKNYIGNEKINET